MTEEKKICEYLEVLSSKAPVPGGGGASALAGALGNALGQMVVNLTVGKKKYTEVEEEMQEYLEHLKNMQQEFLHLSDRDAEVFAPLAECYRLSSATPEEKEHKETVMEEKLLDASMVPVEIMEKALELLEILDVLADKGSRMAVSDVGGFFFYVLYESIFSFDFCHQSDTVHYVSRTAAITAVERILFFVDLCQRGFDKTAGRANECGQPHPENSSSAAK